MTLEHAVTGGGEIIIENLSDERFKGMEKWQAVSRGNDGKKSVIHYVRDPRTAKLMDFKFTKNSGEGPELGSTGRKKIIKGCEDDD